MPQSSNHLRPRALPNSPNGYAPSEVNCPSNPPQVQDASSLSQNETEWLRIRRNNTVEPMRDFLSRMNIANFDAGSYIDRVSSNASTLPNIAMTFSGGGWRALMNGAGIIKAFDSREDNSTASGHLGGLLQSSTYIAGLSGGSWLVGSVYVNNFTTISALQADDSGSVWEFGNSILEGPEESGIQLLNSADYFTNLVDSVEAKENAGFNTSLTDLWARALSYQLINATNGGPAYTWSSIALMEDFQRGNQPLPIVTADGRRPGETIIPVNATNYEFNPFTFGTWDPTIYGFVPLQYLGTNFTDGQVTDDSQCTIGFDNAGFIMGTSSSLFNTGLVYVDIDTLPGFVQGFVNGTLSYLDEDSNDIADYTPNPFKGWNPTGQNYIADTDNLTLVDGGEDLQNIPFDPLIQPQRNVDVIFAIDTSADTEYNWPNGASMVASYERSLSNIANGTEFPPVPDNNTFVNLGLSARPTFFGCDASNLTNPNTPLVVYIPNHPYITYSNISTFQLATNNTQRDAIIANGYEVATQGNGTVDPEWPACVGCAILSRSFDRTGTDVPEQCTQCFNRYCWNGNTDSTPLSEPYAPTLVLADQEVDIENAGTTFEVRNALLGLVVAVSVMGML
jgi:lysophospholipase